MAIFRPAPSSHKGRTVNNSGFATHCYRRSPTGYHYFSNGSNVKILILKQFKQESPDFQTGPTGNSWFSYWSNRKHPILANNTSSCHLKSSWSNDKNYCGTVRMPQSLVSLQCFSEKFQQMAPPLSWPLCSWTWQRLGWPGQTGVLWTPTVISRFSKLLTLTLTKLKGVPLVPWNNHEA